MPALTGPNLSQSSTPRGRPRGTAPPALQRLLGPDRITTAEMDLKLLPEEVMWEFQQQ
jgi:hypothetical protein